MSENDIQLLYDASTIGEKVTDLGGRLARSLATADPLIVSIAGGSVVFLADLIRAIEQPIRFEFIQVQYSLAAHEEGMLEIHFPISVDVAGQSVVIVKDVIATGVIENYLSSQFLQRGAREVRFAALLDLPEERRTEFEADYRLFTPKRAGTFVGYGLKYRGRYGNLAYIGRLADE